MKIENTDQFQKLFMETLKEILSEANTDKFQKLKQRWKEYENQAGGPKSPPKPVPGGLKGQIDRDIEASPGKTSPLKPVPQAKSEPASKPKAAKDPLAGTFNINSDSAAGSVKKVQSTFKRLFDPAFAQMDKDLMRIIKDYMQDTQNPDQRKFGKLFYDFLKKFRAMQSQIESEVGMLSQQHDRFQANAFADRANVAKQIPDDLRRAARRASMGLDKKPSPRRTLKELPPAQKNKGIKDRLLNLFREQFLKEDFVSLFQEEYQKVLEENVQNKESIEE